MHHHEGAVVLRRREGRYRPIQGIKNVPVSINVLQFNSYGAAKAGLAVGERLAIAKGQNHVNLQKSIRAQGRAKRICNLERISTGIAGLDVGDYQRGVSRTDKVRSIQAPLVTQGQCSSGKDGKRNVRARVDPLALRLRQKFRRCAGLAERTRAENRLDLRIGERSIINGHFIHKADEQTASSRSRSSRAEVQVISSLRPQRAKILRCDDVAITIKLRHSIGFGICGGDMLESVCGN